MRSAISAFCSLSSAIWRWQAFRCASISGSGFAEMAKALGVSTGYVNLLENNQRSLSVRLLATLADIYEVDWRDLVRDESSGLLAEMRNVLKDPLFGNGGPDLQELRAAVDHAPGLVDNFLQIYRTHRTTLDKMRAL